MPKKPVTPIPPTQTKDLVVGGGLGGALAFLIVTFAPLAEWAGRPLVDGEIVGVSSATTIIIAYVVRFLPRPKPK